MLVDRAAAIFSIRPSARRASRHGQIIRSILMFGFLYALRRDVLRDPSPTRVVCGTTTWRFYTPFGVTCFVTLPPSPGRWPAATAGSCTPLLQEGPEVITRNRCEPG